MSGWFYRAFEDRYRGSRAVIRERLKVYLPFVQPLALGGATALDLGCGRGEWLELLTETGFAAAGVDFDEGMLAACRERGLTVELGDALLALRARPEASLAVVSAFHLVEHISFEQVQTLITEALRVLQPGGLLILETPNPENLVVGASSFYDDPSHLRPLPPKLLAFAVEFAGFARHNVLRLQEAQHLAEAAQVGLFDVLAGVSPDYAVVAQKAGAPAHLAELDSLFARTFGLDLHVLAQRYQQQQDRLRDELGQLHRNHDDRGEAVQRQLALVDTQIVQVHSDTKAIAEQLAQHIAFRADESVRLARNEMTVRRTEAKVAELEELHRNDAGVHDRLAQHVAWVEGRLAHAEAEAAALRQQVEELTKRRAGVGARFVRAVRSGGRLAGAGSMRNLRRPVRSLLRRVIQAVMRRPALKRVARRLVLHFPRLHTRLVQLMYAHTSAESAVPTDLDPLASQMSPRSLAIYRALTAESKQKD